MIDNNFKAPRSQFGHTKWKESILSQKQQQINCVKKHEQYEIIASFEEIVHNLEQFPIHHSIRGEIHFLAHGTEKELPPFYAFLHLFKYIVIVFLRVKD